MATSNKRPRAPRPRRRSRLAIGLLLLAAAVVALWAWWTPLMGYATTGTSYGARVACSCRFVGGRDLKDCQKDFEPGMEAVFLSEDAEDKSVTAYIPLVKSETAAYRPGYGCVLEDWEG